MLKSGSDYLAGLRDGRVIYVGGEQVEDVTTHPAFRNAARSYAALYDARSDQRYRDALTYEENGERFAAYYLKPRSKTDLEHRSACSTVIADLTHGMMGRSPDFIGGYITGVAMDHAAFGPFGDNVAAYFERARREDLFVSHAVTPPPGSRDPGYTSRSARAQPALAIVGEDDRGVFISGIKMLATSAAFSDEVWIGNIQPLACGHEQESVTCVIPCASPGLTLWSRKPFEKYAVSETDNPLSYRFDESDCIVVCERVHVPWERLFVRDDPVWSRELYFKTAAHTLSNHQSSVRYRSKIGLLIGLAQRITELTGAINVPAVVDELGHLAALYGQIAAMVAGQIQDFEDMGNGFVTYNRHYMYAAIYFATQNYDAICAKVRELSGGGVLQMPADVSVFDNPRTREAFERLWWMPTASALDRFKVMKLAWDILGTDFAGRHAQYERFYMGPAFIVRGHNNRECAWDGIQGRIDALLGSYGREFEAPGAVAATG
jgi:4-hydroxyphenylacetate 3-monooxygenase